MIQNKIKNINYKELIAYFVVGVLTTLVSLGTYYIVTSTFLDPLVPIELQIANVLSWILAVIFAYFTNRKYVFKSEEENKIKEGSKFILSRLVTLLLDMLTMFLLVSILSMNDKIAKIISQILVIIGNYLISKLIVFKKNNSSK